MNRQFGILLKSLINRQVVAIIESDLRERIKIERATRYKASDIPGKRRKPIAGDQRKSDEQNSDDQADGRDMIIKPSCHIV
jgi:hypothetical protein